MLNHCKAISLEFKWVKLVIPRHAHLIESPQFFVLSPMFSSSHIKNWMDKFLNCFFLKLAQRKPWKRGQLLELRTCWPEPWQEKISRYTMRLDFTPNLPWRLHRFLRKNSQNSRFPWISDDMWILPMKSFFQTILSRIRCLYGYSEDRMVPEMIRKTVYTAIPCLLSVASSAEMPHWNETRNNEFIPETTLPSNVVAVRRNPIQQHCRWRVLSHCGSTFPHNVQRLPTARTDHQHHRKVILCQLYLPSSTRTSLSNETRNNRFVIKAVLPSATVIEQSSVSVIRPFSITFEDSRHPGVIISIIEKSDCLHFISLLRREPHLRTKFETICSLSK
jgi:hypothetical protein